MNFGSRKILQAEHHLAPFGENLMHCRGVILACNREHDSPRAQAGEKRLQAQEMTALAGQIKIDSVVAVVAHAPAPKRVVEVDDYELATWRDGADDRVGEDSEQGRGAVGMERQFGSVVEAVVEPDLCARSAYERLDVDERHPRRGERCAQAAADCLSP